VKQGDFAFWMTVEAANFWLFTLTVTCLCLVADWSFKAFKRNHYAEPFHRVQNMLHSRSAFDGSSNGSREGAGTPLTPKSP
jgi:hypothetical protein